MPRSDYLPTNMEIYRRRQKMTQADLAGVLGVSQASVSAWEKLRYLPQSGVMERISEVLNFPYPERLLDPYGETLQST